MFISNKEKLHLIDRVKLVDALIKDMSFMSTEITMLKAKVKVLEGVKKPKKVVSEAQKAKQREYMRKYKAKKKLEAQNGNSVSTTSV